MSLLRALPLEEAPLWRRRPACTTRPNSASKNKQQAGPGRRRISIPGPVDRHYAAFKKGKIRSSIFIDDVLYDCAREICVFTTFLSENYRSFFCKISMNTEIQKSRERILRDDEFRRCGPFGVDN